MKQKERTEKTVEAVLGAAFNVIAEHSISGTTTALIAERAGISKPLLHYHFKTKEAVLEGVLNRVLDRLLEIPLEDFNKKSAPFDEIKGIFSRYRKTITDEPGLLIVFFDFWVRGVKHHEIRAKIVQRFDGFRGYIAQLVRDGVASGEFSAEKSHMVPPLMLSMLEGASLQLISDPAAFNIDLYQYMALEALGTIAGVKAETR